MKSDVLISKYLDGDLSQQEDEQLRRQIAADPLLKAEFNTAVMLHIASRESLADDNLPDEEFLAVESIVLARVRRPMRGNNISNILITSVRRLAAAAILLIASIPISDMAMQTTGEAGSFSLNVPTELHSGGRPIAAKLENISKVDGRRADKTEYPTLDMSGRNIAADISEPLFEHNKGDKQSAHDIGFSYNSDAIAREGSSYQHGTMLREQSMSMSRLPEFGAMHNMPQSESIPSDLALSLLDTEHTTEVQLTTFVSNGMLKIGDNTAVAASVSQSIGYAVNMTGRIGLEIGLIGYSIPDGGKIAIPIVGGRNGKGGVQGADNNFPQSSAQSDISSGYETKDVAFTNNKTVYWGAAFYEQTLLDRGNLTLNARLGAGASPEGPMAYGRAFARYTVLSGISLTLGAESRLQAFQSPMYESLRQETSTGISVVYGIQAKF